MSDTILTVNSLASRITALPRRFNHAAQAFLLSIFITGIVTVAWMLFFNIYILARGIDKEVLGLINAAPSLSALVFGVPLGVLSDRIGRRRAMILGLVVALLGWTLQITLLNPAMIFGASLIAGAGSTLWFLSQAPFMMEVSTEENRTMLFSLNYGLSILVGAVGNLFAGQLPTVFSRLLGMPNDSAAAYQAVLITSLVITAVGILPLVFIREAPRLQVQAGGPPRAGLKEIFTRPLTLKLVLPNLLLGCGASLLVGYFNVFYVEDWKLSDQSLGALFSVMSFVVGLGTLVGPRLVPLMRGKIRAIVALQTVGIISLLILGFSPVLWLSELGLLVRGTVMMIAGALYSAFSMEKSRPEERGAVNSVMNICWQMGWAVGPYVSGIVQVRWGFAPLFIATSIFYASAIILAWLFFGREEKEYAGLADARLGEASIK